MNPYQISKEEKEYLQKYNIADYDRPSVATDMAVFSIMGNVAATEKEKVRDTGNYRKSPEKHLKILLIKRAGYPYKDCWALPGGFCRKEEEVYETARRELYEETHVKNAYLKLDGIYGEVGRDPRGWIISHTFLALIDGEKSQLRAGTDAWEARWFDVEFEKKEYKKEIRQDFAIMENEYRLRLISRDLNATNCVSDEELSGEHRAEEQLELSAIVRERKEFQNYHEKVAYEIVEAEGFAFDHAKIIVCSLLSLRKAAEHDGKIVFDLMPERFTLTELQKAFEIILDTELLVANFRRKMKEYVVETDQIIEGAGHRPAKLFRRNVEAFY